MSDKERKAVVSIVGAGLVGALNAIYFAQRGWKVELYELRPDIRLNKESGKGKSINLALSERGLSALRATHLGLEDMILEASVPMKARMVHFGKEGTQMSQPYSIHGQHINAVDRARLNELLLTAAELMDSVTVHFEHRLIQADLDKNQLEFMTKEGKKVIDDSDLIVGADGAYSKTRSQMMRHMRMNLNQEYIDTAYCELMIPPEQGPDGQLRFALDPHHLHIWPRHVFMLIAIPNPDFSFTCTLFMPFKMFEDIKTEDDLFEFFTEHFNDAIPLIGKESLKDSYFHNPKGSLVTIKASPHNYSDKSIIIGDAAHAMVPFYGQGMNCGFQDVEVLHEILDQHSVLPMVGKDGKIKNLKEALDDYSNVRVKDAHAICDLAMYNYYEMRHAVTSLSFLARKRLESSIHALFPHLVIPLYSMVSFSTIPYSVAIQRWHQQTRWLTLFMTTTTFGALGLTVFIGLKCRDRVMNSFRELTLSIHKFIC
ncbi:hypothetical protein G6F57_006243 [Rhizopus arrhizus]|uniref:Kynurenine 3-monooxygenase n=1 Tax=Rhizopus oryzae TaxID=64495 RepID=A0A9P7BLF0_RHIOR|nr:hypothetical protein G6F23_006503 [Rhizopus arrhizus]KAG1413119.1 hypothetical protein G6F58_007662 [Rhizopus delemar]KAG0763421.1 hypothetical protein G6F24_006024 [Rhizopus arrhizus]KAG0777331.1 hypothetical protein G6F22_011945 [Rhizopus arrhizus]KAG0797877.1 hypothetical protein G6F21_000188 [Rhizopus arrhizus]